MWSYILVHKNTKTNTINENKFDTVSNNTDGYLTHYVGTSLAIQWLRLHVSTVGAWVQFLVQELRSYMPQFGPPKK